MGGGGREEMIGAKDREEEEEVDNMENVTTQDHEDETQSKRYKIRRETRSTWVSGDIF
jgi:hypothetical protein